MVPMNIGIQSCGTQWVGNAQRKKLRHPEATQDLSCSGCAALLRGFADPDFHQDDEVLALRVFSPHQADGVLALRVVNPLAPTYVGLMKFV
jgi:hypothetical protein